MDWKDAMYVGAQVVAVTVFIMTMRSKTSRTEEKVGTLNRVVFKERGGLNMVTEDDCKETQAEFKKDMDKIHDKVSRVEKNLLKIMVKMDIDPVDPDPEGPSNK